MNKEDKTAVPAAAEEEYIKRLHKAGTWTMCVLMVITFLPALYVCIFKGGFPGWGVLAGAAAALAGEEFVSWVVEPIMYFPMVGVAGLYICCTAGNTTTMRIPAALAAQNAVDAKAGTHKAEAASVFAMVASVIVSLSCLVVVVLFGSFLLSILPEGIRSAFNYAIPAVYGAVVIVMTNTLRRSKDK